VLAAVMIAGCGDRETVSAPSAGASDAPSSPTTVTGRFALVPKAPNGFDELSGTAKLTRSADGTDASIILSGLKPNATYASHVHAGSCDQPDPGGPHFKFVLDGADAPPNEIHLPFKADATGHGTAAAHNDNPVALGEGRSIVIHRAAAGENAAAGGGHSVHGGAVDGGHDGHAHPPKIACAPLQPTRRAHPTPDATTPPSTDPADLAVVVKDNEPVGGIQSLTLNKGDRVRFTVTSDKPEEVHTHGYDISEPVGPGKPAKFDFPAAIEGIFEIELEGAGVQIVKLTVNP